MRDNLELLREGFETAFIDGDYHSNLAYRPRFISNDYESGKKVLANLETELEQCDEFIFSVAFITMSGIVPLLQTLEKLEKRNIPGKILTTDYLTFSDPKALKKLSSFKNIELRMHVVDEHSKGFHTKGYLFVKNGVVKTILGSSNLTQAALTVNREWNTLFCSSMQGEMVVEIMEEFQRLWIGAKNVEDLLDDYLKIYEENKRVMHSSKVISLAQYHLRPNSMQLAFIKNLNQLRLDGAERALLISATGTGKTYASAFALRDMNPPKALFLVHREQIAKQAMRSFQHVFGDTKKMGLLSGNVKDFGADYLFSTMQMMAKNEVREQFTREEFQVIIVDEVHRSGSMGYQEIMNYFTPEFWLGMTASPERMDGFDIYKLFDHNIAYEIRLQKAMEENLLCPFHYFGITDLLLDDECIDAVTRIDDLRKFNSLTTDARVEYILDRANFYGFSGERVKGLVFCSSKEEGKSLSKKCNDRGYRTVFLCGEDSQDYRETCIEQLVTDEKKDYLDYIFTVDIFNEGVDIPQVNQVIMLRPTQSPIVFIQQLGRGLRKREDKEFVTILDFIGNYKNNFMIPIALSGDRSYNKDSLRRYVAEGNRIIPGSSTIHFDEITKKRIYESIDTTNFNDIKLIRESYQQLKYKLGRIPTLHDFDEHGEIDVLRIFDNPSLGSYYQFLVKYEKDYTVRLSEKAAKYIEFISKKFASGKRVHELQMLRRLLAYQTGLMKLLADDLIKQYKIKMTEITQKNLVHVMTNEFATGSGKSTYEDCVFIEEENTDYRISKGFQKELSDIQFYNMVKELVEFGIYRNQINYGQRYLDSSFQLYAKYTYEDVCRLLEWEKGEVALNIGGYKYDSKTKTYPVFINYHKEDSIQDTVKYEDRFLDPTRLIAISKSGRTLESEDVKTALRAKELGVQMELFVRKNKDDKTSKEFYYLGRMYATGQTQNIIMPNTSKNAVEIEYQLLTPVREDIFDYIVG